MLMFSCSPASRSRLLNEEGGLGFGDPHGRSVAEVVRNRPVPTVSGEALTSTSSSRPSGARPGAPQDIQVIELVDHVVGEVLLGHLEPRLSGRG